tara:strand:- start:10812 stop:12044 length:1233 start_codon:yes stop_codon:yes gene_type:complete
MGISDEAARLRESVPEQFQPRVGLTPLSGQFDTSPSADSVRSGVQALNANQENDIERIEVEGKVATAQGPLSEAERAALTRGLQGEKFDEDRRAEMSGTRAGRIETTGLGAKEKEAARLQTKLRADASARMQQILALQAALNERLEDLYEERSGLLDRHLSPEEKAAIEDLPEDQQNHAAIEAHKRLLAEGKITQEEYDAWLKEWQEVHGKIQKVKAQQSELAENLSNETAAQNIQDKADVGADLLSVAEKLVEKTGEREQLEQQKLTLEDLEHFKGTEDYVRQIDAFVSDAGPLTLDRILEDSGVNDLLKTRINLFQLKGELADLEEFKGTTDYPAYVQLAISEAPSEVRQALRNEQNLNDEVAAALYESFSDTLDDKAPEPTNQAQDKPDNSSTQTSAIAPPNHPGIG